MSVGVVESSPGHAQQQHAAPATQRPPHLTLPYLVLHTTSSGDACVLPPEPVPLYLLFKNTSLEPMAPKVQKREYERWMTILRYSVVGLILSFLVVTLEIGGLQLAGGIGGVISTFGILYGVIAWVLRNGLGMEQKQQSTGTASRTTHGGGSGGDVGYLEYQCERCGTVLDDWNIDEMGSSYTCGECGYHLDNQRAAREKVDEGWAWDEEEGLA